MNFLVEKRMRWGKLEHGIVPVEHEPQYKSELGGGTGVRVLQPTAWPRCPMESLLQRYSTILDIRSYPGPR